MMKTMAADDDEIVAPASLHIPEMSDLLGIDPAVYRQINCRARLRGKRHINAIRPAGDGEDKRLPAISPRCCRAGSGHW